MKTKITKVLALTLCAVLLVVGSVMGTVAYLTAQDSVTNTFTYGNVKITMDEVNAEPEGEDRDSENGYKLIPGQEYTKNTTIHVEAGSEACYLFVKIDDAFAKKINTESANTILKPKMAANWKQLNGVPNVYYYDETVPNNGEVLVMESFTVSAEATNDTLTALGTNQKTIIAYAVQQSGFTDVKAAWDNTFGAPTTPGQ